MARQTRRRPVRGGPRRACAPPVALAVAADAADFERLRRHRLFGAADHGAYLRRTERQLRVMRGAGVAVHLRVLEADGYEEFCARRLLAPADPVARAAYAADPELPGEPYVYAGEGLAELLPALLRDHRARAGVAAGCSALLDAVERGGRPQARLAAFLGYAAELCLAVAAGAGEGRFRLELRAEGAGGEPLEAEAGLAELVALIGLRGTAGGRSEPAAREAEAFAVTLAAVLAGPGAGELLLTGSGGADVRGWSLAAGRATPLTTLELRALPPPGPRRPREAFPLPPPPDLA
ncbi:hypothetical protein [Kitasatospora terrestris]|uniref:hypothetical protein n=1 Tax=Kitasatospora terrestris TaxID=258051 RepID=UPI0031EE9490